MPDGFLIAGYTQIKSQHFSTKLFIPVKYNKAMKKNGVAPLLRGLPYWLYIFIGLCLAGILYFIYLNTRTSAAAALATSTEAANTAIQSTFTADEADVKKLIENFEVNAHNINTYRSADKRATYYTGTYLEEWNNYFASLDGTNSWTIVSKSSVSKLKVVSSSADEIVALACVSNSELSVDQKGKLLKQLPVDSFAGAYVFVPSGTAWKVANFIDVSDSNSARQTYASLPADLQELSGSISQLLQITCN